jgi:hypothetical protein
MSTKIDPPTLPNPPKGENLHWLSPLQLHDSVMPYTYTLFLSVMTDVPLGGTCNVPCKCKNQGLGPDLALPKVSWVTLGRNLNFLGSNTQQL